MEKIDSLEGLRKKYQQKYGVAVFDIEMKNTKSRVEVKGNVLTENQKDDVLRVLKDKKIKIAKEKIEILSDASRRNEIGWAVVKEKIIDLRSRFVSSKIINCKILNRVRCSQAFKDEILRVLYKYEDQLLIQQNDLTLGWVNKSEVVMKKKSLYKEWRNGNFAVKGGIVKVTNRKIAKGLHSLKARTMEPTDKIIKEAGKYLGVKYVLGGKSKKGIDCSGFIQVVYKNSLGIILPKHSWDQKIVGGKVKLKNIKTGDLIFLIKKKNRYKHVGIVERSMDKICLIHSSLDKRKVVRQSLEEVLKSYNFIDARRVVSL